MIGSTVVGASVQVSCDPAMQRAYVDMPLCSLETPAEEQVRGEACFVKASPSYSLSCKGRRVGHTVSIPSNPKRRAFPHLRSLGCFLLRSVSDMICFERCFVMMSACACTRFHLLSFILVLILYAHSRVRGDRRSVTW